MPPQLAHLPGWTLGLANGAMILVGYGIAGAIGLWLGSKAGLPGVYRPGAGWRAWGWTPILWGLSVGVGMVAGDHVAAVIGQWKGFEHPGFPLSLIASASAGIGEEIVFRGFVMGLCAFLLSLVLKRPEQTPIAVWIANIVAALAFVAGHLPTAMLLFDVTSPLGPAAGGAA